MLDAVIRKSRHWTAGDLTCTQLKEPPPSPPVLLPLTEPRNAMYEMVSELPHGGRPGIVTCDKADRQRHGLYLTF